MRPRSLPGLLALFVARTRQGRLVAAGIAALLVGGAATLALSGSENRDCGRSIQPGVPQIPIERRYVFYDASVDDLEDLQEDLEALGYHSFEVTEGPTSSRDLRSLWMRKTDQLDLSAFRAREAQLCELAKRHDIESYWSSFATDPQYRRKPSPRPTTSRP
jgi:hypothetical protein